MQPVKTLSDLLQQLQGQYRIYDMGCRLCKISSTDFNIEKIVTCSFGVSQFEETDSGDSLLTRVDDAMYYVKRNGKNNVKVA